MLTYQSSSKLSFLNTLILFPLLLFYSVNNAQVDSLLNKSYNELSSLFKTAIEKDAKLAFRYADAAYKHASKSNDQKRIGESLYFLAKANNDLSKNGLALQQLTEVIQIATQLKDSVLLFKANNFKGNVYNDLGNESKALEAYIEAKKSSAFTEKANDLIVLSINIAFIKKLHSSYEDAVIVLKENLALLQTITIEPQKRDRYELIILMNLADTYLRMNENDDHQYIIQAEYYNREGLEKCRNNKNTIFYNVFLMNEAIIHYEKRHYQKSIEITKKVEAYAKENTNEGLTCTAYFYLGKNYFRLQNYSVSIRWLNKAYVIMKTSERSYSNEKELHELLTLAHGNTKELEKMKFHFELYNQLEKQQRRADVKIINEIHNKNDIPSLKDKIEALDANLSNQKRRKLWMYILSVILAILLALSIMFYRRKVYKFKEKFTQVMQKVTDLEKAKTQVKVKSVQSSETITDKNALKLLAKLTEFEEKEEFLVQGCTLIYVAEKLNTNTTYLSKVINTHKEKTFNSYLNELRINKALVQLKNDRKLRSYTIKGISEEFGFKRQETFSRAFKQQTGIYPSQYLKKLSQTVKDD